MKSFKLKLEDEYGNESEMTFNFHEYDEFDTPHTDKAVFSNFRFISNKSRTIDESLIPFVTSFL